MCIRDSAGPGWNTDPFSMGRREGWLLGRGVIDDKGPAVLSLYAGAFFLRAVSYTHLDVYKRQLVPMGEGA